MNVSLTKKLEKWVRDQVKGGNFETASEVVRDALRDAMRREEKVRDEKLTRLRADIAEGLKSAKSGWLKVDANLKDEIIKRSKAITSRRRRAS
jgi:antitoxin ParD1/3/4